VDILFAVLPFADVEHPAIGTSLLQAQLKLAGFSSAVCYFNLDLAERIGPDLYGWLAQCRDEHSLGTSAPAVSLVGEWFFADLVFHGQIPQERDYIAKFLEPETGSQKLIPRILEARRCLQEFIDQCALEIERQSPRAIGFTTTFHQTCACLALAIRLKQAANPPIIVFGGANCEGEMGLQMIRSFPWLDYVCTGEGDEVVPWFLRRLLHDGDPRPVPGILKQGENQTLSLPPPVKEMDALPIPDYSDYFQKLRRSPLADRISPRLLIETSRGCWWGEKQHCTFCGLNGETMAYRSKSPKRVVQELSYLRETYGLDRFDCADNILDLRYIATLFPELAKNGPKVELFYETKSNLRFEQLRTLRLGGVRSIQPGIESFSNKILRLMRKGCTGLQNIQLLRWSEELGISVSWNILYGFPDEPPFEYRRMAMLIPLLTHLQPPTFCEPVRMDRFSPIFADPGGFGLARPRPMSAYSYVYPLEGAGLERLAYFFEFEYADGRQPGDYVKDLIREVERWAILRRQQRPQLDLFQAGPVVLMNDTRPSAFKQTHVLSGVAAKIYLLCDAFQSAGGIARKLNSVVSEHEVRVHLESFLAARLMVEMEGHYLSLAVMRNRACPINTEDRSLERESQVTTALVNLI
jgi:ribosomal peptide maturation radical SAM protein 1